MEIRNSFLSSGNSGDTIAALPAMREFYRKTGIKPTLYLRKDVKATYYDGAVHPVKNKDGETVMLNQQMIDMLSPLLKAQPFLEDVKIWVDEEIACDLDSIRETNVGMPSLSINRWYFYVFPDLACDLSKPWLVVPNSEKDLAKGKIIITRTERYRNDNIDYSFLKPYEDELIFSGTMREYNNFCMTFDLNIKKLTVDNFLTLAQAIKQSRFHITNQTMANQISTGLMHPSILEVCTYAPNCIPIGEDRYDFLAQAGLEWYFHKLYGDLDQHMGKVKAAQIEQPAKN
jgi:hypothetical protein